MPFHIWFAITALCVAIVLGTLYAIARWFRAQNNYRSLNDPSYHSVREDRYKKEREVLTKKEDKKENAL